MTRPPINNDFNRLVEDRPIKIGILDIETTDLDPVMGDVLCVCIKDVREKSLRGPVHTIRIDDKRNRYVYKERWVIEETIKLMDSYDCLVHWYGSRFDIPYIVTKAFQYKLMPPIKQFRRDLCFVARGIGKLRNNRLATWGRFLFGKSGKTFLDPEVWKRARQGDKSAIEYIVTHCEKDVIETEKIYKRFMPLMGKLKRR